MSAITVVWGFCCYFPDQDAGGGKMNAPIKHEEGINFVSCNLIMSYPTLHSCVLQSYLCSMSPQIYSWPEDELCWNQASLFSPFTENDFFHIDLECTGSLKVMPPNPHPSTVGGNRDGPYHFLSLKMYIPDFKPPMSSGLQDLLWFRGRK